ncbi:MAG: multiple sugar transport system substrate-binding protein [Microbacteriaceae bacterium]|jgi:multiple sugar transport system substrate-binding protein|nr:multiple sugar transport system substrate-binding protein [Microbacteriaceae bacterium]
MLGNASRRVLAAGSGVLAAVLILTGCSSSQGTSPSSSAVPQDRVAKALKTPTNLTFWTWLPDIQKNVDLFEKKYPAIKVKVQNVGNGTTEFTKIRTALKSGKGAPDVVQLSTSFVSSFVATDSLMDLTPYGAADLESDYLPSMWNQVASNGHIYAVPQDWGPVGTLYRKDLFAKAGISQFPKTWDDFASAAAKLKAKTGAYITNFAPDPEIQVLPIIEQTGTEPFGYDGKKTVTIAVNNPEAKKALSYWQKLIQKDLVSVDPDFTDQWYHGLASGKYATWLSAAWGPLFLQGTAKGTSGKWRADFIPQWDSGKVVSPDAGGSSNAVLKGTKNPIAAYELTKWINNDKSSTTLFATQESLFPTAKNVLSDATFTDQKSDFFGGQQVNKLYGEISKTVSTGTQHLPFMDYVDSSFGDTLGKAIASKGDLSAGLDAWQKALVTYAKQQGFTVK